MRCAKARVDEGLEHQAKEKKQYLGNVLQRVVTVIKFLATRGMAFRGDNEVLGSPHNGIFLCLIELLAQFDPFLESHLKNYGNAGRGMP